MSAVVMEAREPSGRYLARTQPSLMQEFGLLVSAPSGVTRLRAAIKSLAVRGRLVPQDASDEPAAILLQRVLNRRTGVNPVKGSQVSAGAVAADSPYVLPRDWAWAALGDLVENMGSGWSPACDAGERTDVNRWAVLRTTAIQDMEYRPEEHKTLPTKLSPRPEIEVRRGDILITRAGPMNRVGITCDVRETPPRLMLSDKIVRFHPIDDELLPSFVVLALNAGWSRQRIESAKTGMAASQVNISQSDLRAIPVPVCGRTEQHRIVARVEELMKLCDALEAKGRLADEQHARLTSALFEALVASESAHALAENWQRIAELFDLLLDRPEVIDALEQTILQLAVRGLLALQDARDGTGSELLERYFEAAKDSATGARAELVPLAEDDVPFVAPATWAWARFGDVANVSGGVTLGRKGALARPINLPYLRVANVQRGRLNLSAEIKTVTVDAAEVARFLLKAGDLLVTEGGDWDKVGRTCIWREEIAPCLHQNHVFKARGHTSEWLPAWGELYLNSADARAYFAASAKQTTNLASINMSELRRCAFPLPPLAEQHRIVARVEELRRLCAQLRERLTQARQSQTKLADALVAQAVGR